MLSLWAACLCRNGTALSPGEIPCAHQQLCLSGELLAAFDQPFAGDRTRACTLNPLPPTVTLDTASAYDEVRLSRRPWH
jgi:hypothetical protein